MKWKSWSRPKEEEDEMASSTFSDEPMVEEASEARSSFTIVINENGEIDYDPSALQDIIGNMDYLSI